ncbi:MAG: archaellin/type IV pilin N-terminal domain-containing protein [Thermoplasmataceae archaeon]
MKQIINKEDKAVSPIIATILLIAITVVLAATLYTVLGGFTKGLSSGNPTASVSFVETSPDNYSLSVNSISGNVSLSSVVLQVFNGSSTNSINLGTSPLKGKISGLGTVSTTHINDNISYVISNGGSNYLSPTTSVSLTNINNTYGTVLGWSHVTITSIILKDTSTNSALTTSTPPSPSIIVAQVVFRVD